MMEKTEHELRSQFFFSFSCLVSSVVHIIQSCCCVCDDWYSSNVQTQCRQYIKRRISSGQFSLERGGSLILLHPRRHSYDDGISSVLGLYRLRTTLLVELSVCKNCSHVFFIGRPCLSSPFFIFIWFIFFFSSLSENVLCLCGRPNGFFSFRHQMIVMTA
jgi:hypothetical protein